MAPTVLLGIGVLACTIGWLVFTGRERGWFGIALGVRNLGLVATLCVGVVADYRLDTLPLFTVAAATLVVAGILSFERYRERAMEAMIHIREEVSQLLACDSPQQARDALDRIVRLSNNMFSG